jgi:hypothetical protein
MKKAYIELDYKTLEELLRVNKLGVLIESAQAVPGGIRLILEGHRLPEACHLIEDIEFLEKVNLQFKRVDRGFDLAQIVHQQGEPVSSKAE